MQRRKFYDNVAGEEQPKPRMSKKDRLKRDQENFGWYLSCFLLWFFGAFGMFFAFKEFGDPWFSDTVKPGPGSPLLGDSGRLLMFEAGSTGVQSELLGGPAWLIEGIILALGSLSLFTCWFKSNRAQLLTVYLMPLEACYYLVNIVYFSVCNAAALAVPMTFLGCGLLAVCIFRAIVYLRREQRRTYYLYLCFLVFLMALISIVIFHRAKTFRADLDLVMRVRRHFAKNGKKWTKGLKYPDGFEL